MSLLAMNGSRGAPVRLPINPQLQTFRAPPLTSGYDPLQTSATFQGRPFEYLIASGFVRQGERDHGAEPG